MGESTKAIRNILNETVAVEKANDLDPPESPSSTGRGETHEDAEHAGDENVDNVLPRGSLEGWL